MTRLAHMRAAIPWAVVGSAAMPGLVLVAVGLLFRDGAWALGPVRVGLLLLAVPAAFLLDDAASGVAAAAPRSPWWDLSSRSMALLGGCLLIGGIAWAWDHLVATPQAWVLALIPICAAVAAVAGASLGRRFGRATPGDVVAGVSGLVLLGLLVFTPARGEWEALPWPGAAGPGDVAAWLAVAGAGLLVLIWASGGRASRTAADA